MSDLYKLRTAAGLSAREVAELLKPYFPKMDKTCVSKAESEDYGLTISPKALWKLRELSPAAERAYKALRGRKADRHKLCRRVTVRLTEEQYAELQHLIKYKGCTMQEYFAKMGGMSDG